MKSAIQLVTFLHRWEHLRKWISRRVPFMVGWISLKMVLSSLVFIFAAGCFSVSEGSPIRSEVLMKNVFTNLTHSFAQALRFDLSSAVSQGDLPGISLGSAGSKAGNIGAASSYGVGQLEFMRILIGVSAAKSKTSEAVSKVIHSHLGRRWHKSRFIRVKRDDVKVATSLSEVVGFGAKSVLGSTGSNAGPVATSISLGSILLATRNSFSGVNAGALAAHAGNTDASNTFSNSNIAGDTGLAVRRKGVGNDEDEGEVEDIKEKDGEEEKSDEPAEKTESEDEGGEGDNVEEKQR